MSLDRESVIAFAKEYAALTQKHGIRIAEGCGCCGAGYEMAGAVEYDSSSGWIRPAEEGKKENNGKEARSK